jgi:hypothetical protein
MQRWVRTSLFVAAATAVWAATAPRPLDGVAVAGDAKIADALLKNGKQAYGKGDFAGALSFFKKAQEETPELIEACWWRASAQEKSGDKSGALVSYREFLASFDEKTASGTTSKEEQRLKALAEKSVDALAAGEKEFRKLEDAYVASLLAFAKDALAKDPGACRRAVAAILAVRPEDPEALQLNEKVGGGAAAAASGPGPEVGPFKDVKSWRDLIADQSFRADEIGFADGLMTVNTKQGKAISPAGFIDTGKSFAFEYEFRITSTYDPKWVTGLGCASKDGVFVAAIVLPGRVVISRTLADGKHEDFVDVPVRGVELNTWHRLGMIVKGPSLEVWFDGKKTSSWREPSALDLVGDLLVVQERCRTEWRLFHVGKAE